MPKVSAGLLMCRHETASLEVLLVHPGGPFFAKRDDGAWTIPKGLIEAGEDPLLAARREFREETGFAIPDDGYAPLGQVRQKGGKVVHAWAFIGDCDPDALRSNEVEIQWPPRSGRRIRIPEVDRAAFFDLPTARRKILEAQIPLLERAVAALRDAGAFSPALDPE